MCIRDRGKYAEHAFLKTAEAFTLDISTQSYPTFYRCLESYPGMPFSSIVPLRRWNGEAFGTPFLEQLVEVSIYHGFQVSLMTNRLKKDAQLKALLQAEIGGS